MPLTVHQARRVAAVRHLGAGTALRAFANPGAPAAGRLSDAELQRACREAADLADGAPEGSEVRDLRDYLFGEARRRGVPVGRLSGPEGAGR